MKVWKIVFSVIGIIPWIFIISLLVFYVHADSILGYWPVYDNPDPAELNISNWYSQVVIVATVAWYFSFPAFVFLAIIYMILK